MRAGGMVKTLLLLLLLGAAGCASLSSDPNTRTPGVVLDDQVIESMVKREIWNSDPGFANANIVVVSFNGVLLLAGQVESDALRAKAEDIAKGLERVRRVHNEMEVAPATSMVARANDTYLTTRVKTRMMADSEVTARNIKVVTENGVVYLMGIIDRAEADRAVEVVQTVHGVQKIVKVFEYI
jgi:osmotically-inducible protein OsmY